MKERVVLIGVDGATYALLDPLMDAGVLPFLQSFIQKGARAELQSVIPPLTPPAWTSLVTGRRPGAHGVFDFFAKDTAGEPHIRLANSHDIQVPTLWDMANEHALQATVLNFPLTFPPPGIRGYVAPGWMPWRQLRLGCSPPDLYDRLKDLPGFNARELAMDMSLEEKTLEGLQREEYADWIALHIRREHQWLNVFRFLESSSPSALTAILFDGVDKIQHLCWRFLDPRLTQESLAPWEQKVRELCLDYFRQLDQVLSEIDQLVGSNATVIIASDHGFGPTEEVFYVNAWLERQGYLAWAENTAEVGHNGVQLGVGQQARHVFQLDWGKTLAYVPTPTSNGIHIVVAGEDGGYGISPSEYAPFRATLVQELSQLVSPVSGEPLVSAIWTREEIFAGPHEMLAPDLTLSLRDGGLVSILPSETPIRPRTEVAGTHRSEGIFLARGPHIRAGRELTSLSILDVAPVVLYSLGLPILEELEGRVATELFDRSHLDKQPIERQATASDASASTHRTNPEPQSYTPEAEAEILARLRALGYID